MVDMISKISYVQILDLNYDPALDQEKKLG